MKHIQAQEQVMSIDDFFLAGYRGVKFQRDSTQSNHQLSIYYRSGSLIVFQISSTIIRRITYITYNHSLIYFLLRTGYNVLAGRTSMYHYPVRFCSMVGLVRNAIHS